MAYDVALNLPTSEPPLVNLAMDSFKRGVITVIDQSRLPKNALKEAQNIFLYEDGMPGPRPGIDWFGIESPNSEPIDGADFYQASDGTSHIIMIAGGNIYRSDDDGDTFDLCSGATFTSDIKVNFEQNSGYLFLTNGIDDMVRYDGTTTLQVYAGLTTPNAPTAAGVGFSAGSTYTYYYKVAAVNEVGFSIASASGSVSVLDPRNTWSATKYVNITFPAAISDATRWDIYISENNTDFYYIYSADDTTTVFRDDGSYAAVPTNTAPTESTASGPLVEELNTVGSRMFGVRDTSNKYRIWYTGVAPFQTAFSSAYDGGWVDWQEGGKDYPVQVKDYRDGKGTPYATIWCDSANGEGSILQMTLDSVTIGDLTYTEPSIYKLPGSRGTPAPGSVINVLNDYMFYNSQAIYNLGSRVNFQNLLSTDEATGNIRPTIKQISSEAESGIVTTYFDARVYYSVPIGSTTNNRTAIWDTEKQAWLPEAFMVGFDGFIKYTDNSDSKGKHLLCWKAGDTRLSEISYGFKADYGEAFETSIITGLMPVSKNRFDFMFVEQGMIELAVPRGQITVELMGIERTRGYSVTKTNEFQATLTNVGWDTFAWDTTPFDDSTVVPDVYSESSVKRYFEVQREMNAYQWKITTNSKDTSYILRTLQINGTLTQAGMPPSWRI